MQTFIREDLLDTAEGKEADSILRSCVHCGFCLATCPTYRLLGDEQDSPRGRIYLIKSVLEGKQPTHATQLHLDRCLTCLACETICPSGVQYGRLLDIGRREVEEKVPREKLSRLQRFMLLNVLPYRRRFAFLVSIGQTLRGLLPRSLRKKIPPKTKPCRGEIKKEFDRKVILFNGCVQPSLKPQTNESARRVLAHSGISVIEVKEEDCCGALAHHLGQPSEIFMKQNIDAWWPHIDEGVEAIVNTASGCGSMLKEYGHLLRNDPEYRDKAKIISEKTKDIVELFDQEAIGKLNELITAGTHKVVFQSPCTLQHGQRLGHRTETLLKSIGLDPLDVRDSVICCGSAGTYSIFQPGLSQSLRSQKLENLTKESPDVILTSNIGCQLHLQEATDIPVKHWIEFIDELISQEHP